MNSNNIYVEQLADGVRYRMPYCDPLTHKTKRVSVKMPKDTPRNRHLAEDILVEKVENLCCVSKNTNITIQKAVELYLADKKNDLKPSTFVVNSCLLKKVVEYFEKGTILNEIPLVVFKNALRETSVSDCDYNNKLKALKTFLSWAYTNDLLTDSKIISKLSKKELEKSDEIMFLEQDEIQPFLEELKRDELYYLMAKFTILSGLRIGEVIALEIDDIKPTYINVNKTYAHALKAIQTAKTADSMRYVSINTELLECIKEIKRYRTAVMSAYGFLSTHLFFNNKGEYAQYQGYRRALKQAGMRSIGREVKPHQLRHTHASMLLASGVSLDTISRRLGHADTKITESIYIHVTDRLREHDNKELSKIHIIGI